MNSVSKLLFRQSFTDARPLSIRRKRINGASEVTYYIDIPSYFYSFHNFLHNQNTGGKKGKIIVIIIHQSFTKPICRFCETCNASFSKEKASFRLLLELLFRLLLSPVSMGSQDPVKEFLWHRFSSPLLRGYSCRVH